MKRPPLFLIAAIFSIVLSHKPTTWAGPVWLEVRWHGNYDPTWTTTQWDIKAEAMKRHIALLADLHVKCDYFLTPAEVEYLASHYPSLIAALKESGDTINHYDPDEPPTLSPLRLLKGKNWHEDVKAVLDFATHKVDTQTGEILPQSGGLGLMTQIFGARVVVSRRSARAPIIATLKKMGMRACIGSAHEPGPSSQDVWFMGMLHLCDRALLDATKWAASADALSSAPTTTSGPLRRVTILITDRDFIRCGSDAQRENLWSAYTRLLKTALDRGMKPADIRDLIDAVIDEREPQVTLTALEQAADYYLKECLRLRGERLAPPLYIELTGQALSLADAFQFFQQALAWWRDAQYFAPTAKSRDILGPTDYGRSLSRQTRVELMDVVQACVDLLNKTWHHVPHTVQVGKLEMNPAEFLYLMCRTYQRARKHRPGDLGSDQALPIAVLPTVVQNDKMFDDLTKLQFWTLKPVRWK